MRSPKLDQKAIKVLPSREGPLLDTGHSEGLLNVLIDRDLLKVLGFDGLKCHGDPPNAQCSGPKHHFLETRGLGEVEGSRSRRCT